MLTLSREVGEYVLLRVPAGPRPVEVKVYLTQIRPKKVRLSFDCPAEVEILRSELAEAQKPKGE